MSYSWKNARRAALPAAVVVLSCSFMPARRIAAAPTDLIAAPITVQASESAAQTAADEFLTGFITTAVRLEGPKFISSIKTAAKLRPDFAGKIVVCSLNIARLNSHLPGGRLSCATIDQIVTAAVTAAPQSAASIVKAAIESEPYARGCVVAAAIAAAPGQEAEINAAANEVQPMSMLTSAGVGRINPADNAPLGSVNSPEQPPIGP
jgi:hypothetical protein